MSQTWSFQLVLSRKENSLDIEPDVNMVGYSYILVVDGADGGHVKRADDDAGEREKQVENGDDVGSSFEAAVAAFHHLPATHCVTELSSYCAIELFVLLSKMRGLRYRANRSQIC